MIRVCIRRPCRRNDLSSPSSAFIHRRRRKKEFPLRLWAMACVSTALSFSFTRCLRFTSSTTTRVSHGSLKFAPLNNTKSLKLSSSSSISGVTSLLLPQQLFALTPQPHRLQSLTVVSATGYKMKTHKASAKRFRVTGRGKIVRRRAGKQHLLAKKNTKRKLRLSKMHPVSRSDYDNVIGALPYLKVNRQAT